MSIRHLKNLASLEQNSWNLRNLGCLQYTIYVNDNSILLVAWAKTVEVIFDSSLFTFHIQSISKPTYIKTCPVKSQRCQYKCIPIFIHQKYRCEYIGQYTYIYFLALPWEHLASVTLQ